MTNIGTLYAEGRELGWLVNAYTTQGKWRAFARLTDPKAPTSPKHPGGWGTTEEEAVTACIEELKEVAYDALLLRWEMLTYALQENVDVRS